MNLAQHGRDNNGAYQVGVFRRPILRLPGDLALVKTLAQVVAQHNRSTAPTKVHASLDPAQRPRPKRTGIAG